LLLLELKNGQNVAVTSRGAPNNYNTGLWENGSPKLVVPKTQQWTSLSWASDPVHSTQDAACAYFCTAHTSYTNCHAGSTLTACAGTNFNGTQFTSLEALKTVQAFPSGYGSTTNGCALSDRDSVKWPSDSIPTFTPKLDASGIELHPQDPDLAGATPTVSEIQNPNRDYSTDPYGNPTSTTFTPKPGGGYSIDQRVQTTNNNQTTTTINNITINNAGQVTNIYTTTVPGGIELASPTATPVSSGSSPIQFPTDYNRETTQQAVKSKLDDIQAGTGAPDNPDFQAQLEQKKTDMNQEITEKLEAVPGQYSGDKGSWFSWVWTPPVGNCSPWISTIHGQSVSWDVCPYVEKVRDVIGFLLALFGGWSVYNEMFRRNES